MSMCTLSNRPTTPSGFERTLNPVSLDALIPMGLMQAPEVGAVMLDTELRIVWVNEAAERLIGGPPAAGWAGRWLGEVLPGMDAGVIERSLRRGVGARRAGVRAPGGRPGGGRARRGRGSGGAPRPGSAAHRAGGPL